MPQTKRLRCLDAFRGLTVAAMVAVNCSGREEVYAPLAHAAWHGWSLADLVFPSFLVALGASALFSFEARRTKGQAPSDFARYALLRALGLFALGMLVDLVLFSTPGGARWPGVLQRIALCSLGVSGLLIFEKPAAEASIALGLLAGYWLAMMYVPVPGHGAGILTPEGNLAYWLDRTLFAGHTSDPLGDEEGLLSTLPALATALLGLCAGRKIAQDGLETRAAARLGVLGLALAALGAVWGRFFPVNKHLWTSSYALLSGGLAVAGLGALALTIEGRTARWAAPFEALGRHALTAYILSGLLYGIQEFVVVRLPDGAQGNVKLWLVARLFDPWLSARAASLAYALAFTALCAAAAALYEARLTRSGGPR
ncbi:MAG TPA: DUF5009 domain-containing protein [Elusimicrobia bacterium]|nr:MAG: hypothetical protein A2X37_01180 [Elusimicrobia bacterium GWA2_66_18]OGR75968.1 MAG: hypothetical protein A2X40_08465 [Elusimicrobia bacterium GWC2_65_9]HAZ09282.1 DUF5009 domain-containing protein [Elusimicrobiota bacterium]